MKKMNLPNKENKRKNEVWIKVKKGFCEVILPYIREIVKWLIFRAIIPGFPIFIALVLAPFIETSRIGENITIVKQADLLLLGATFASGVLEKTIDAPKKFCGFGGILSFVSLLFLMTIFFTLYFPNIDFVFRSKNLENKFITIICVLSGINMIMGLVDDIFFSRQDRREPE